MKIEFEKKGTLFTVILNEKAKIIIEAKGKTAYAGTMKHHEHGWAYTVSDKDFAKALGFKDRINIVHESAEQIKAAQDARMKELHEEEKAAREKSEEGRKHLSLVYYFGDYTSEFRIAKMVKMNEKEEKGYREEYKGRMHYGSIDGIGKEVSIHLDTVQQIKNREPDGYAVQGGTVWYITEDEKAAINEEIAKIKKAENEEKAASNAKAEADRQAKFDEAKRTGMPVVLEKWTDDCDDQREECSLDVVTVYAMPDGSTETKRHHTW